jgi:hypothetical protein
MSVSPALHWSPLETTRIRGVNAKRILVALVASALAFSPLTATAAVHHSVSLTTMVTLPDKNGHVPAPPKGATDEYRCTLFKPHWTTDQLVLSNTFHAATPEVHHAILYLVSPSQLAMVQALDPKNKGWSCFASPLGATSMGGLEALPWLAGWSPGHGTDMPPTGYGEFVPAGSAIVMQIHYNTLAGTKADKSYDTIVTAPAAGSSLVPLHTQLYVAAPDLPCPAGVTGALCSHAASLADLGKRFGQSSENFTRFLEQICNGGKYPMLPTDPNATSASCLWPVNSTYTIHRITPHMHLLGATFSFQVCHQDKTCSASTSVQTLFVQSYSFDNQVGYDVPTTTVYPGDYVKLSCSWNVSLRSVLPQLRTLPPRYITWGDGSSDEMCLATLLVSNGVS